MGLLSDIIASVLEDKPDTEIVGRVTSVDGAFAQVRGADGALVSTRPPDNWALRITEAVVEEKPAVKFLVSGLRES